MSMSEASASLTTNSGRGSVGQPLHHHHACAAFNQSNSADSLSTLRSSLQLAEQSPATEGFGVPGSAPVSSENSGSASSVLSGGHARLDAAEAGSDAAGGPAIAVVDLAGAPNSVWNMQDIAAR
jgi:hypothetical protein